METVGLQIRRGNKDNSRMTFLFLSENIHCDLSLETVLMRVTKYVVYGKIRKLFHNYPCHLFSKAGPRSAVGRAPESKSEILGSISGLATYFLFSFR